MTDSIGPDASEAVGLRAVLGLTKLGPIFPLYGLRSGGRCGCGKESCANQGKHPRIDWAPNGLKDAGVDPEWITTWWRPEYNVAVVWGHEFSVIDADSAEAVAEVEAQDPQHVAWYHTGRGKQWIVPEHEGRTIGEVAFVGMRGVGAYSVAPPSRHKNGSDYRWGVPFTGEIHGSKPPSEIRQWLTIRNARLGRASAPERHVEVADGDWEALIEEADAAFTRPIPAGGRDIALRDYAYELVHRGFLPAEQTALMRAYWGRLVQPAGDEIPWEVAEKKLERARVKVGAAAVFTPVVQTEAEIENAHEEAVRELADRLEIRREAERRVRQREESGEWSLPDSRFSLAEELAIDDPSIEWEVEGLHERGSNVLLTAAFKTGKTTLALNLMGALLDGEQFLGSFPCSARGRVAWWNFELTERQARRWLRDLGIKGLDRGSVLHMRGHKLPIHSDHARDALVSWLKEREITYLIVDPFGSAYGGKENDNDEVREWTRRLDEIKALAGVDSVTLVAHTGRGGQEQGFEHARGATKLDDWADTRWIYTKDKSDADNDARYFYANGRDVEVDETPVRYDETTRRLSLDATIPARGSKEASNDLVKKVCETVIKHPGLNRGDLVNTIGGRKAAAEKAVKKALSLECIVQVKGTKPNEKLHHISPTYEWATAGL